MPNDVKAGLSAITVAVALVLAYWSGSPIRHEFSTLVVIIALVLVAAMRVHRVTHILTFNTADFARYAPEGVVAVDPAVV